MARISQTGEAETVFHSKFRKTPKKTDEFWASAVQLNMQHCKKVNKYLYHLQLRSAEQPFLFEHWTKTH